MLPTATSCAGDELPLPEAMSFTSDVPTPVPVLFHNSVPLLVLAEKKSRLPATVRLAGDDADTPEYRLRLEELRSSR